jgi:YVTN family beta-propeller protein
MTKKLLFAIISGVIVLSAYSYGHKVKIKHQSIDSVTYLASFAYANNTGDANNVPENKSADNKLTYLSPGALVIDSKKNIAYTCLTTSKSIAITDLQSNKTIDKISLKQNPNNLLLSPDGSTLFVSCGDTKGTVEIIKFPGKKIKSIKVGHTPQGIALSVGGNLLYVANRFNNNVSVIDLSQNKITATIPAVREPRDICISPDGKTLAIANFLPNQASNSSIVAAQITLADLQTNEVRSNITLNNGAQSVGGIAFSNDGNYLYATHLLSQYNALITQLDRGWVNTSALSIIDLKQDLVYATVLLDNVDHGAANPAGIYIDNQQLYITLSGTHELMTIDLDALHQKLAAFFSGGFKDVNIQSKNDLATSFSFMASLKKRISLQGRSPRAVACISGTPVVSSRFGNFLEILSSKGEPPVIISLGNEPEPDAVRRGELAFCDATICYQQWQSCVSCHPDGRADGFNWDQQNDGLGNPKNTKSLLFSHVTPPSMITGIRETAELAVRKGILHTLQTIQPESLANDIDEYLKQLPPSESPYMDEYRTKDPEQKGKAIFERAGCLDCHGGKYFTDLKKYNVGTGKDEYEGAQFDTPTLREIWRTSPYLYDGRTTSVKEVLTIYNKENKHGITQHLSEEELNVLVLYINTL